jgi:putative spermidine/putrescine transport system permease protein
VSDAATIGRLEGAADTGGPPATRRRLSFAWVGLMPFFAFVGLFLLWPAFASVAGSLFDENGFTTENLIRAMSAPYARSIAHSMQLSVITAVLGGAIGTAVAYAISVLERPRWLRSAMTAWSGVAANLGGVPLAFAFIAAFGNQGLVTRILKELGFDLIGAGFRLSNVSGLVLVYLYFQIPLMLLVMAPAIDGLRPTWREAASGLGASPARYWRHVGFPILFPSLMGGLLLLFANAFSAYATAYSLTGGQADIVPLQIRFVLQGNTITGEGDLGNALAAWMIVIMAVAVVANVLLQKRTSKWLQ